MPLHLAVEFALQVNDAVEIVTLTSAHPFIRSFVHSFIHSFNHLSAHPLILLSILLSIYKNCQRSRHVDNTLCVFRFPLVWPWCIYASYNALTGRPCLPLWFPLHLPSACSADRRFHGYPFAIYCPVNSRARGFWIPGSPLAPYLLY